MKDEKKPHTFGARNKPFTVAIDFKNGAVVTGRSVDRNRIYYFARFTKPVKVVKGDTFMWSDKNGFVLNGKPHAVKTGPLKKMPAMWAWAPKRMRVAIFPEKDETFWDSKAGKIRKIKNPKTYWVAMDVRGYWLGCGDTVQGAFRNLIDNVQVTDQETRYERRRGVRIIRWHCHKKPDVQKTLREAEAKARKHGFILEGVDWKNSLVSKADFTK